MQTLEELKGYCELDNPVGALLLTGEWGCGKTYLVENELRKSLDETHSIVRISLFGIPSIEEVHRAVKNAWIHERGGFINIISKGGKFKSAFEKINTLIPNDLAKTAIGSALSVNFDNLIKVENTIDGKKVILVFDDMERSTLSSEQKLGVINEYCENQHFNVIIIADEDKLSDGKYEEIKEKVVQRTVHFRPDYEGVVDSVIGTVTLEKYKELLFQNRDALVSLFAGLDSEGNSLDNISYEKIDDHSSFFKNDKERERKELLIKNRPHNIRSLKSAVQDFERVYRLLLEQNIDDAHKWLLSFLSFSMVARANLIQEDENYVSISRQRDVDIIYPGYFDSKYMPMSLSEWIMKGIWNVDSIKTFIEQHYSIDEKTSPKELVKYNRIDYFEENIAIQGMRDVIPDVYEGNLSLNQYVQFIINSHFVQYYGLPELTIEWEKVYSGINKRIKKIIHDKDQDERVTLIISDIDQFSEEEQKAYSIIKKEQDYSITMFEINRNEYIELMSTDPSRAFIVLSNKRYNCFDNEMADATLKGYKKADHDTKAHFPGYFNGMWQKCRHSQDIIDQKGMEKSKEGFEKLKDGLIMLLTEYKELPFKKKFTEVFIENLNKLLNDEEIR